ncbi:MAG: hypothetical protein M0T70_13655 [Geobacteraceae bacterium]|nr:hypothetical protein [Geobacteraceae bacterium]
MTDLLLITDVPRLRKIFSRLSDNRDIRLRIANNLEKGGDELVAEKPAIVFVQTHLSGLSAEIILMHLKKQLGRKRTRFVLLSTPEQTGSETMRLYQGHIDTSLDDETLLNTIKAVMTTLLTKPAKKTDAEPAAPVAAPTGPQTQQTETALENVPARASLQPPTATPAAPLSEEPSLVDQGLTYAPRPKMSVYSEFNSSFDSAVNSMKPAADLVQSLPEQKHDWDNQEIETAVPVASRSKRAIFLLWLAPVVIAVVVITMLQHKRPTPATTPPGHEQVAVARKQQPATAAAPIQPQKTATPKSTAEPDSPLSDKSVLSAIAENHVNREQSGATPVAGGRLTVLPDFIPRAGFDKAYANSNPGWERYKGQVTEFKVFREGKAIKAIQVIDRGGNGVPESFMKAVLRQVCKNPVFVKESSEKKEGYEILRGHVADNLKVMYYRDDQGGKLRAFVLTWQ